MPKYLYVWLSIVLLVFVNGPEPVFADNLEKKQVIVVFDEALSEYDINETIKDVGADVTETYEEVSVASVQVTNDSLKQLLGNPAVKHVEEDIIVKLSAQIEDWGIAYTNIPAAWKSGFSGKGVKVAVIDSGIAPHNDLFVSGGVSTVDYTSSYHDDQGHGTHVAGIIGARNNNFGVKGVAYETNLYAVKAFNQNGEAFLSDLIEGINWSITNGMDIINLSAGTQTDSAAFHSVIDKAYSSGLLIVAAAGNDGAPDGLDDTVDYPARYSSAIGVAAIDRDSTRAPFSSTGSAVEVAAPGVRILSTYIGNQYAYLSGTSMATPYVTGELALLKQAYPKLTNKELRMLLIQHIRDLGPTGRDVYFGYGLIQASSFTEPTQFQTENPITGLTLSSNSLTGMPGDAIQVTAFANYKDGKVQTVTNLAKWTSANPGIAGVTAGRVELKSYGNTTVTVTYEGQTAVLVVNVPEPKPEANPIIKLEANKTSLIGKPGDIIYVAGLATFKNGEVHDVTNQANWTTSDASIATVTAGKVELKSYGSATLMVSYESQSATIVVNSPKPQSESISYDFKDVTSFYSKAVDYLVRQQVTQGFSNTEFGISKNIIRADAAIWLAKELSLNIETAKPSGFEDVPNRAVGAVNALKEAGIIGGKSQTRFGAYDSLTRGEVALILQRSYQLSAEGSRSSFTDVSPTYREAVDALVANKITNGLTETQFGISSPITRGQLAVFLYRLSPMK